MFHHLVLVYTLLAAQLLFYRSCFAQCAEEKRREDFGAENSSCYATSQCFKLLHILCYCTPRTEGERTNGHRQKEYVYSGESWRRWVRGIRTPLGLNVSIRFFFFSFYATFIAVYPVVYKNYETYFALCLLDTEYLIKYGAFQIDEIYN